MNELFKAWPKIPRWGNTEYTFTEKIDGTNACVIVTDDGQVLAQSRTRIITLENDNFGFAKWVYENKEELKSLGVGYHFGEWWGQGIQRRYNLDEKRFSLFNPWKVEELPSIVHCVPVIRSFTLKEAVEDLKTNGSYAAPGFMDVEGVVIYCHHSQKLWKYIINKPDDRDNN